MIITSCQVLKHKKTGSCKKRRYARTSLELLPVTVHGIEDRAKPIMRSTGPSSASRWKAECSVPFVWKNRSLLELLINEFHDFVCISIFLIHHNVRFNKKSLRKSLGGASVCELAYPYTVFTNDHSLVLSINVRNREHDSSFWTLPSLPISLKFSKKSDSLHLEP